MAAFTRTRTSVVDRGKSGGKQGSSSEKADVASSGVRSKRQSTRPRPRAPPKPAPAASTAAATSTEGDAAAVSQLPVTSSLPPSHGPTLESPLPPSAGPAAPSAAASEALLPSQAPSGTKSSNSVASPSSPSHVASDTYPPPSASPPPSPPHAGASSPSTEPTTITHDDDEMPSGGNGWFLPEKERLRNVARNRVMFQQLKENFAPTDGPLREELREMMTAARGGAKGGRGGGRGGRGGATNRSAEPVRRSSRHGQHAEGNAVAGDSSQATADVQKIGGGTSGTSGPVERSGAGGGGGEAEAELLRSQNATIATGPPPLSQAAQLAIGPQELVPSTHPPAHSTTYGPCPPSAPKWFSDAYALMTAVDLGCHYNALIAAWTRMEQASRFEHGPTRLPHKLRPQHVSTWITRGRRDAPPSVDKAAEYAVIWQSWWDSLQPAWRVRDGDGRWSVATGYGQGGREWGPLYHWGVNGVLSIVASLFCWGRTVLEDAELRAAWDIAVCDVVWMLEGMATYYEMFKGKF
ncbi:hypothetical protein R3P38DRAFT_3181832 [Favolaschia claudopus]|uniref:Uncharacterized protein n=1 Tax=Favolaschia claudopus TaxID=2862362 RepID=A0AAW0CML8_9AGAR